MAKQSLSIIDENRRPASTILMLAWPIFVEQLLIALVQAADSAMVGSLGASATASVAINSSFNTLINGIYLAFGVGFTSLIARSIGAQNYEKARSYARLAILVIFAISLPIALIIFFGARALPTWMGGQPDILDNAEIYNQVIAFSLIFRCLTMVLTAIHRGYGDSKTPMKINVLVNILNVIGNFIMIYPTREMTVLGHSFTMFGCGWGVGGAALSTSLSTILGGTLLLIISFVDDSEMRLSLSDDFRPKLNELKAVLRISLPGMMERFIMGSAFIVVGKAIATLGTAAVAAQNLAGQAESISFMPGFAFGAAATTLFGQSIGADREDLAKKYVTNIIKIGSGVMAVMTVLMFTLSSSIMGIFTPDAQVIAMGSVLLKILAVIQIPQMIAQAYSGALKGAGDAKSPFLISLISMWGIRLAGTVICIYVFHMGLTSACVCMCTDNAVRCVLFYLRYHQSPWKKIKQF